MLSVSYLDIDDVSVSYLDIDDVSVSYLDIDDVVGLVSQSLVVLNDGIL